MLLKAFFAYPNTPRISDAITEFCRKLNGAGLVSIETWEEMRIGGKLLVSEICRKIDEADLFCADITCLNPNVLFEIGYAIARKKRIWLVRDNSIPSENSDFKQFKILTTLGFREYLNSNDIISAYYTDLPHESLDETVYDQAIEPEIRFEDAQHVLYLKSFYEDEPSIKVTQFLDAEAGRKKMRLLIDDPREASFQPLGWYAKNVHSAQAVLCHLTTVERENSKIQNAKHSLVAGMAHGFGIPLLLLIENELFGPADYRDLLCSYRKSKDAVVRVERFIAPVLDGNRKFNEQLSSNRIAKRKIDELAMLRMGEPIAEHEQQTLTEAAFIETAPYHAALDGSQAIFVGRKGVGKTANFIRISQVLSKDKRVLVCEIKPLSYELEALIAVAKRFELISKKGFLFESLWKFLIYSELARQVVEDVSSRPSGEVFSNERDLINLVESEADILKLDFSARLDKLSRQLLASTVADSHSSETAVAVSELLHAGIIKDLLHALISALQKKIRIVVLIDNLDKAWDRSENTKFLCYFFLGLLSAMRRITNDFKNRPDATEALTVSMCVFIRADIFEIVLQQAREPDKIQFQRIAWDDRQRLRLLADNRLLAAAGLYSEEVSPDLVWRRFFVPSIYGASVYDFIFSVILPRPRDLLYFLRSAISSAVNRRHERVQEDDFLKAEEDYSEFVYQSVLVELREKLPHIESIMAEFMGSATSFTKAEVQSIIRRASSISEDEVDQVIASLAISSFLELEVPLKGFITASDDKEYDRLYKAAANAAERNATDVQFRVHRAFRKTLLIDN